jgi:hypothetical protein
VMLLSICVFREKLAGGGGGRAFCFGRKFNYCYLRSVKTGGILKVNNTLVKSVSYFTEYTICIVAVIALAICLSLRNNMNTHRLYKKNSTKI